MHVKKSAELTYMAEKERFWIREKIHFEVSDCSSSSHHKSGREGLTKSVLINVSQEEGVVGFVGQRSMEAI